MQECTGCAAIGNKRFEFPGRHPDGQYTLEWGGLWGDWESAPDPSVVVIIKHYASLNCTGLIGEGLLTNLRVYIRPGWSFDELTAYMRLSTEDGTGNLEMFWGPIPGTPLDCTQPIIIPNRWQLPDCDYILPYHSGVMTLECL